MTTLIAITVAALAAYGIVRFFKRLGSAMSKVLVTTYIFPPILLAIPYSVVMGKLGLINTRIGLVIVYLSFSVPYAVWLLTGFFRPYPWKSRRRPESTDTASSASSARLCFLM